MDAPCQHFPPTDADKGQGSPASDFRSAFYSSAKYFCSVCTPEHIGGGGGAAAGTFVSVGRS